MNTLLKRTKSFLKRNIKIITLIIPRKFKCSKNVNYKNLHKGKRCFIIGNGPSLKPEDLDLLNNEITFGTNRIYGIYGKTKWRPTYYCIQDFMLINDLISDIIVKTKESKIRFFPINNYRKHYKILNRQKNIKYFYLNIKGFNPQLPRFSEDISKEVFEGQTITYTALQIAIYMGFKEIYLLGIDHSYSIVENKNGIIENKNTSDYFSGAPTEGVTKRPYNIDNTTLAYLSARNYAEKNGVKIYNTTRGGKLDIFERIDFCNIANLI